MAISAIRILQQTAIRLAHVQLARHHVGDEPSAILLHQLDLPARAGDRGIDVGGGLVKVFDDGGLFGKECSNTSRLSCALAISLANRTAGPKSQSWLTMMAASYCRSYVALTRSRAKLISTPFSCPPAFTLPR